MALPAVRVNTFVTDKKETNIDLVSKVFVITDFICGINRLQVFGDMKPIIIFLSLAFSISINCILIYMTYLTVMEGIIGIKTLKLCQYCLCAILGFAFRKRLSDFYAELNTFDVETGFRRENVKMTKTVVQMLLIIGFVILFVSMLYSIGVIKTYNIDITILLLNQVTELCFFGHLFNLFIPRILFIRRLMKSSFDHSYNVRTVENDLHYINDNDHSSINMKKLMSYYHRIIIAFDILNEAIKWQMLIIFVTCFVTSLIVSYDITLRYIRGDYFGVNLVARITLAAFELIPMFAPCKVVDAVHGEVFCLKELLSSKLYENKIEKSSRAEARALLALMEARDLAFSLLRIFDIDVSFPFKFLGLLVTYLIILLQFQKVINLDRSNA